MHHFRRMAFPLRSFSQHPSVSYYLNFSSICLCLSATKVFFGYPLGPFAHLCTLSTTLFHTSTPLTTSVVSCPGLPSRDILQQHRPITIMICGWKSYGSGILTQLQNYIPNPSNFLRLMVLVLCSIFCYGLDLLVVVSLFLSAFSSLFYDVYTCVRLSLLPSLFVKQIYFFVLRFMFAFFFSSFPFVYFIA